MTFSAPLRSALDNSPQKRRWGRDGTGEEGNLHVPTLGLYTIHAGCFI